VGIAGTSLEIEGTIAIEAGAPLNLLVYGPIDLSLIASRFEALDLSGDINLDASIEGTVSDPMVVGVATLADVAVSHDDVFLDLSGLRGDIFLDGPRASLMGIRGVMGGGSVAVTTINLIASVIDALVLAVFACLVAAIHRQLSAAVANPA